MEELLAYAYLIMEGFDLEKLYESRLNELFVANPCNNDLLELELLGNNIKDSLAYIMTHMDYAKMEKDRFGKELMKLLKPIYKSMDIERFGNSMFSLWELLAGYLQNEEPFFSLAYADDPISWGDKSQSREIYEKMLSYYD